MSELKKIRVGIIGCGGIANGKHMPGLSKVQEVEMVAFCDIIEEKAVAAKEKYGTPDAKVYTDYKELLKDTTIDVVHVCTPNRSHSFITVDALESGKHVMCEKPMAKTAAEAKKMVDAAKRTGKKLTIGYQTRFTPEAQYIHKLAERDEFGDIYFAKTIAIRRRGVPTWGVFLNEEEQGGGPLIDIGTHSLDITLWQMNNYKPLYCVGTTYHKLRDQKDTANPWGDWDPEKFTVEDSAFGFVVMENGATIMLESSWALNSLQTGEYQCVLCGTKAGVDQLDGVRINKVDAGRQVVIKPDLKAGGVAFYGAEKLAPHEAESRAWIDAILNDTDPMVLPEQAYTVTQILEGIYESAKTGKPYYFNK